MGEGRFELEWDRPSLPGASTHVSLFEGGRDPLHILASGHGPGETDALRDLLQTLRDRNESADAIAFVSDECEAQGRSSARSARFVPTDEGRADHRRDDHEQPTGR